MSKLGVVLMAGGRGVRLRPLTYAIPKPLLPFDGVPILKRILGQVNTLDVDTVHISVGYMADFVQAFVGDNFEGMAIRYIDETEPRGTVGALGGDYDLGDDTLIINGDLVFNGLLAPIIASHHKTGADMTIGSKEHRIEVAYGVLQTEPDGTFVSVDEKPTISMQVSCGMNVISAAARELIPKTGTFNMPELIEAAKAADMLVRCEPISGEIVEVSTIAEYQGFLEVDASRQQSQRP